MLENIPNRPTEAIIDLNNLIFNFNSVKQYIGVEAQIMAVVKANAYGHGAVECGRRLAKEGVESFAVAILEEALELRKAGIPGQILCLGGAYPGQEGAFFRNQITPVVFELTSAKRLNKEAGSRGMTADVHIKVDTGMGRVGVPWAEASEFANQLSQLKSLNVQGLMSHFASADDLEQAEFTRQQIERLDLVRSAFSSKGFDPIWIDIANSPGAIVYPESRGRLVRIGGLLYGLGGDVLPSGVRGPELRPVLSLTSRIAQLKVIPPGSSVGYGRTFVADRSTTVATVPIGYHDGYPRGLADKASVIINGHEAPVIGKISMDWINVDVTDIPGASLFMEVTLIGSQEGKGVRAEDIAAMVKTISYEITCGIGDRVPRRYKG